MMYLANYDINYKLFFESTVFLGNKELTFNVQSHKNYLCADKCG